MPTDTSTSSISTPKLPVATAPDPQELAREHECPFREKKQCLYLNHALGWSHGYSLGDCDECWARGGASTREGLAHLKEVFDDVLTLMSSPGAVAKAPRPVLVALTLRHQTIDLETFRVEAGRTARARAIAPLWKRATSFFRALTSKFTSTLPAEEHALRHISCMGTTPDGVRVTDPCPSLKEHEGHQYCGACGCGFQKWAAVDTIKLTFPELSCPRDRPGFTPCSTSSTTAGAVASPPTSPGTPAPSA